MTLFIGIESTSLTRADRQRLQHPDVCGVILFARNFLDSTQLRRLIGDIRYLAPNMLISVDHEGGRVQRFRHGFTAIPAMARLGEIFDTRPILAVELTRACGMILAYELRQVGIDFSFAPVLDLRDDCSTVIGERAFHANPAVVATLSCALRHGMAVMGMVAVGKHYPGHGRVQGDSHHVLPQDTHDYAMREADRYPFIANIRDGIEAIMTAHIMLPENQVPAGFASNTIAELRRFGFDGVIFSDDLDMAGAKFFDNPLARVQASLQAGADATMICNQFTDIDTVLEHRLSTLDTEKTRQRLAKLKARLVSPAQAQSQYNQAQALFGKHLV